MRKKYLFATMGIALALGTAFAINHGSASAMETKAAFSSTTKKLYLCSNWNWGTPKIHYWNDSNGTEWDSIPSMTLCEYSVVSDGIEGCVYSYELPIDVKHIVVASEDKKQQTDNFDFGSTWGDSATTGFYFKSDSGNKLVATELTFLENGYYLVGNDNFVSAVGKTGTEWTVASGVKMDPGIDNNATYVISVPSDKDITCKARKLTNGAFEWLGADRVSSGAGTYVFYVDGFDSTSLVKGLYVKEFAASFLADMQDVCGTTSAEWENDHSGSTLSSIWAKHKDRFENDLSDEEQAKFVTSSGTSGVARAAGLYVHAKTRYSLSAWENGPSAGSSTILPSIDTGTNNALPFVISVGSVALLSAALYFVIKRRKEER